MKRLPCGHLSENDKDYDALAFKKIYLALAITDAQDPGDSIPDWLNANGFANMTCCPECHVDDFGHVQGCKVGNFLALAETSMESIKDQTATALRESIQRGSTRKK